jgi:malonate-semialdehyde dehydrogenase (acetylating)/methylmalonate-semialdehyde dehydrogenase
MVDTTLCKCLIGGKWTEARTDRTGDIHNPSTGEVIARVPMCSAQDVDAAVQGALKAFPAWRDTPPPDRARYLFRFHSLLERHADEVARIISREHGKTFAESKASVQRGLDMIEFACGIPSLLVGESVDNLAPEVDSETVRHPLGVVVGITPFNFPAMVPMWMYPTALVCGNCFILKPSPRVPLSAIRTAELLMEAGLPEGVFSVVHGDKTCVDALLTHPDVKAISFVGSTPVAKYIYSTGAAHGKRVQAAGGAKNHLVIMPDADVEPTVRALQHSAYGCAGERCMAGSLAVAVGEASQRVIDRLAEVAGAMRVGRTDTGADVDMGPLISHEHLERVRGYVDQAEKDGAKITLDGRKVRVDDAPGGYFFGPTIVDQVKPNDRIAVEEVFGPVLSVTHVRSLEEAIALNHRCQYGNGAVIFTRDGRSAREFKRRCNAGMVGINVGVPAPMAWFPFTGWNASFFGDLHIQGREGMAFYTQQRMTLTRWFEPTTRDKHDPVWRPGKS